MLEKIIVPSDGSDTSKNDSQIRLRTGRAVGRKRHDPQRHRPGRLYRQAHRAVNGKPLPTSWSPSKTF